MNLLRRLATERVKQMGLPALPIIHRQVSTVYPLPRLTEQVVWESDGHRIESWDTNAPQDAPAASLRLSSGTRVRLFVTAGGNAVRLAEIPQDEGILVFKVPLPATADQLKDLTSALSHIDLAGDLTWIRCPDADRLGTSVLRDLEKRVRQLMGERAALRRMSEVQPQALELQQLHAATPTPSPRALQDDSPWAACRKHPHAFLFYGLKDGTAWLIFPLTDGRMAMAPYPRAYDGWDEAMPPRIGTAAADQGIYIISDRLETMVYLSGMSRLVRTASSWAEVLQLPWPSKA